MKCGAVLGLGYVGLELAAALSKSHDIIGYDTNAKRLEDLRKSEQSGLKNSHDFCVGYSPERINPGDTIRTLINTTKIISASDHKGLSTIKKIYLNACEKIHPVSNIKTVLSKVKANHGSS